jgi:hypothetical protein
MENPQNTPSSPLASDSQKMSIGELWQAEREAVTRKIVELVISELEEPGKGNLTTTYVIGILKETISKLEKAALMHPASHYLKFSS